MKNNEIKKRLRAEADSRTPDPLDKIKAAARAEGLLPREDSGEVIAQGGTAVKSKAKRNAGVAAAAVALVLCVVLVCVFVFFGGGTPNIPAPLSFSASDVYGMGAVSTARLLGSGVNPSALGAFSALNSAAGASDDGESDMSDVKAHADKFNGYFTALDSFLGEDVVTTTTAKNTDATYEFDMVMTVTGKDLSGKVDKYTMYYTETLIKSEVDEEDGESEKEYRLKGVMIIDGAEYSVAGGRTEERDGGESESELKIRAYADASDENTYIEMSQEHSADGKEVETEYVYSVYVDGELVEQTAVDFETERKNGKEESEYELEFRYGEGKGKYKLEREVKNGKVKIKVKYDVDGDSGVFHISEKTVGGAKHYEYVFKDGSTIVF